MKYYSKGDKGIIVLRPVASDCEIELSAVNDTSEDFISEDELHYYLDLSDK